MGSFAKYVGGCPTNIAIGCARLGLKAGLITAVGDEHMGRFIREQLAMEGVDLRGVKTDPERLTALVILGIRDDETFPLIFYRENCADAALCEADVDEDYIASAGALVVTGTHFSKPNLEAASRKAMAIARSNGAKVVFDVDYRPVLWDLTGHGEGEERFVESARTSAQLQSILADCDLVVGTEEEIRIAGGTADTLDAIRAIRALSAATIVCKRGPMGCVVFPGEIPASMEDGISGPGFPVDVYNVLGAGDAFMAGFLRGWLRDEPIETCCAYANACGAFAVSRHGCAPAIPSWTELAHFLEHGSSERELRRDEGLGHIHWATTRPTGPERLIALAIDHRSQFEELAARNNVDIAQVGRFKMLALRAARQVAAGQNGFGLLLDGRLGREALHAAGEGDLWIGRPIEQPGSRPLGFEGRARPGRDALGMAAYAHREVPGSIPSRRLCRIARAAGARAAEGSSMPAAGPGTSCCWKSSVAGMDRSARTPSPGCSRPSMALDCSPTGGSWNPLPRLGSGGTSPMVIARHDPYCRGVGDPRARRNGGGARQGLPGGGALVDREGLCGRPGRSFGRRPRRGLRDEWMTGRRFRTWRHVSPPFPKPGNGQGRSPEDLAAIRLTPICLDWPSKPGCCNTYTMEQEE